MMTALQRHVTTGGSRPRDRRNCYARTLGRECGGYNTREGKKPASTCETLLAPGARAVRGQWPNKPITGTVNEQLPISRQALRPARRCVAEHACGHRGKNRHGSTSRKREPPTEGRGAARVAYGEINNASLDLAAYRAGLSGPSRHRPDISLRRMRISGVALRWVGLQLAFRGVRRFLLTAQLFHASAYSRKVVSSTRLAQRFLPSA